MQQQHEHSPLLQKQAESNESRSNQGICEPTIACCDAPDGGSFNVSKCCIISWSTTAICAVLGIAGYPLGELIVHGAEAAECAAKIEGGVAFAGAVCIGYSAASCPRSSDFGFHHVPPAQGNIGEADPVNSPAAGL